MFVGIDPGTSGGIALLTQEHKLELWKMPVTEHDISSVFEYIATLARFTMIESVHSMPGQGVASSFTFGRNYGFLRGMLVAHKISFIDITPRQWQAALGIKPAKGGDKSEHKNRLKGLAQQIFPTHTITLATADAALIAEYVFRIRGKF